MKGILYKTTAGWMIKWSVPQEYKIPVHEIELHPIDVQAREPSVLGSYGEVEFEVVSVDYGSGVSKSYGKIISVTGDVEKVQQPEGKDQTAFGWFLENLPNRFKNSLINSCQDLILQAKEKEAEQIVHAYDQDLYGGLSNYRKFTNGKEYYQETYGGKK